MNSIRIIIVALIGLQMIGCASTGPRFNPTELEVRPDMATVYFYRPWAWTAGCCDIPVVANGKHVASLPNGDFVKRFMAPGIYKFHSQNALLTIDHQLDVILDPGKITYLRASIHNRFFYTDTYINEIDAAQAIEEISEL